MNRVEFIQQVTSFLKEHNIKKAVNMPAQRFKISDRGGSEREFVAKQDPKSVIFTFKDVASIVSACIEVMENALSEGEDINIRGFGRLYLHYRNERRAVHPVTGEPLVIAGRYVPRLAYGKTLRLIANVYGKKLNERRRNALYGDPDAGTMENSCTTADEDENWDEDDEEI